MLYKYFTTCITCLPLKRYELAAITFLKALMEIVPYVSDEEQEEIEKIAEKPEDYDENEFEAWNGQ